MSVWISCPGCDFQVQSHPQQISLPRASTRHGPDMTIHDLPIDVIILVFSLLHGQDIARCMMVCRYFADIIHSDLHLQYMIELVQSGMVDGDSSTLAISERLQRLREYSSRFRAGNFNYEDLAAHPHYVHQTLSLPQQTRRIADTFLSQMYSENYRCGVALSVFTPGSVQAGVQSSRSLLHIGTPGTEGLPVIVKWAIDEVQDLLVMADRDDTSLTERLNRRRGEFRIRFYSLHGSKTTRLTPHPSATLPAIHRSDIPPLAHLYQLHITGQYVIWELPISRHDQPDSVCIEVCNWRTGEVISHIDIGTQVVDMFPLDHPYILALPRALEENPHFHIYSFSPSASPNHHICTLELADEHLGQYEAISWHKINSGDQRQASEGHFYTDMSQSVFVLRLMIGGLDFARREVLYLIPRTTFLAQIQEAEAQKSSRIDGGGTQPVPWTNWGSQGCLRLSPRNQDGIRIAHEIPFGSRFPHIALDESDFRSASVYVFDVNPHVARRERQRLAARQHASTEPTDVSAIVEDIEAALPGVVDPDCSVIPYVVYRFKLPYTRAEQFENISKVVMSMTGFTLETHDAEYEKMEQTWTV